MPIHHLINGQSVASKAYFETINPATQQVLAEVASGGEAEVHAAVAAAKAAFPKWAGTPAPERAKLIRKLGDLIAKHVPEIAQLETNDCGQVIAQTGKQLIPRAADNFYYFAEMCTRVDGHTYPTPTHLNYTLFHPVGVCALISPWNVPFMTATWKVAPCLAFGNTAVLKMSELSPLTAARLGELALEAGIPAGVLNVVHGFGKEAGEPLCAHPDVRAISFTGSTATGNRIVKAAGLKKFSMELGGKSPFVIFDDANLDRALDAAIFMIFSNNGERCTAGSRILVQQSTYADFVEKFVDRARRITGRRPARRKNHRRPDDFEGPPGQGAQLHRTRPQGRRHVVVRRPGPAPLRRRAARGGQARQLRLADRVCRRGQPHAHRPGRNLRPGGLPDSVQGRGPRHRAGQRHSIRPLQLRLDREPRARAPCRCRRGGRHVLRQQPERARPAPALRRHQGQRHRARRRHLELRGVLRAQERGRVAGVSTTFPTGVFEESP
jgi:hypothetical protein